jgi:hypothetical protein
MYPTGSGLYTPPGGNGKGGQRYQQVDSSGPSRPSRQEVCNQNRKHECDAGFGNLGCLRAIDEHFMAAAVAPVDVGDLNRANPRNKGGVVRKRFVASGAVMENLAPARIPRKVSNGE